MERYVYLVNHTDKELYTIPVTEENGIDGNMNAMKLCWNTFAISGWNNDEAEIKIYKDTECSLEEYKDYRMITEMISSFEHRKQDKKMHDLPQWKSYEDIQRKKR